MAVRLVEGGLQSFDPSQQARTTIRKGTDVSSGSSSTRRRGLSSVARARKAEAAKRAESQRQAESQKQAEIQRQADILKNIKLNQERAKQEQINKENLRIQMLREKLIRQNAQRRSRTLIEETTRDKIKEDVIINRKGERILVRTNLRTGEVSTTTFEEIKGNGVQLSGGITTAKAEQPSTPVEKITSKDQVGGFIGKIEAGQQNAERRRLELRKELQGMTDKTSKRASKIKNELIFMTVISEVSESALGIKQLGDIIFKESKKAFAQIREDPKMIVPISKAIASGTIPVLRKVADGLLEEVRETGELLVVSPNEGFVKLGLIWLSFKSVGGVAKITGKATKLGVKSAKKASVGSANVIVRVSQFGGKKVGGRLKRGGLKLNIIDQKKFVIKQIKTGITQNKISELASKAVRDFEKRSLLKLDSHSRLKLKNTFIKQIEDRIDKIRRAVVFQDFFKSKRIIRKKPSMLKRLKKAKRKAKAIFKKKKQVKKRIVDIAQIQSETTRDQLKFLTKRLTKEAEKRSIVKWDTHMRFKAEKQITDWLNGIRNAKKRLQVPEIARKVTLKQKIIKKIRETKRKLDDFILGKRPKVKTQIINLNQITAQTNKQQRNILIGKLVKEYEKRSFVKFDTHMRFAKAKEIGKKIDDIIKAKAMLKVPEIARKLSLKNSILRKIKDSKRALDDLILGKKPKFVKKFSNFEKKQIAKLRGAVTKVERRILKKKDIIVRKGKRKVRRIKKKLGIIKPKKKKVVFLGAELRELFAVRSAKNTDKLSKMIARKIEELSPLKFDTAKRFSLQKATKRELIKSFKKGNFRRDEIIKLLQTKSPSKVTTRGRSVRQLPKLTVKPKLTIKTTKGVSTKKAVSTYKEVKSRGMVLLQKTKQIQKQTTKQKSVLKQKLKSKNVNQVQAVSQRLRAKNALLKTKAVSLRKAGRSMTALLPFLLSAKVSGTLQKSAQDTSNILKSEVATVQESVNANNTALGLAQQFISKQGVALRSRLLSKTIKKKVPVVRIEKIKKSKKKKQFDAFAVKFMSKGKVVKSKMPLSFQDAKDLLAYRIDRRLIRTGKVVPVGKVSKLGKLSKGIKGAFNARKKKFRIFRLKKKKKVKFSERRFIEKKQFVGDTKNEIRLLRKARAKARNKRKVSKKKKK